MNKPTKAVAMVFLFVSAHAAHAWNSAAGAAFLDGFTKAQDEAREREHRQKMQDYELERERLRIENIRLQRERQDREREQESRRQVDTVQAVIDRIPKLKQWSESNQRLWNRAAEIDSIMKDLPEHKSLSLEERFRKVVRYVEAEDAAERQPQRSHCVTDL